MHVARRTYEHPRTRAAAILLGALAIIAGCVLDRHVAPDLRAIGIVLFIGGVQISTTMVLLRSGYAAAHREGYRRGRRVGKPVVVLVGSRQPVGRT